MSDWNTQIIEEFRANNGKVAGPFEKMPLLLLHHTGARTGTARVSPLAYQEVDSGFAIFASKAGADSNPDWYYNLKANPKAKIEVGTEVIDVKARVVGGSERETIWERQKARFDNFAEYERKTSRNVIPVIVLERV